MRSTRGVSGVKRLDSFQGKRYIRGCPSERTTGRASHACVQEVVSEDPLDWRYDLTLGRRPWCDAAIQRSL